MSGLVATVRRLMSSEAYLLTLKADDFKTREALAYLNSLSHEHLLCASDVEIESKYKWFIQRQVSGHVYSYDIFVDVYILFSSIGNGLG